MALIEPEAQRSAHTNGHAPAGSLTRTRVDGRPTPFGWPLAIIALVALLVRLADALTYTPLLVGDPVYYHTQANLIASGKGFAEPFTWIFSGQIVPTAFHPPLYPLLLSFTSLLGFTSYTAHQVTGAFIGVGTVVAIAFLGREVAGARVGLIAAALAAVYPNLWLIDARLWSEDLAAGLTALALLACYRLRRRETIGAAVFVGVALGFAGLARPETLLLLVIVAVPIALLLKDQTWGRRFLLAGAAVLSTIVVLSPWFIRNVTTFERPVLFSTSGDLVLSVTNCRQTYFTPGLLGSWAFKCSRFTGPGDESEISARARDKGVDYLLAHKRRFVKTILPARVGRVWDVYAPFQNARLLLREGRAEPLAMLGLLAYWAMVPFAIAGVWLLHKSRKAPVWPLLMEIALVTMVAAASYGATRFRAPAETVLLVLAAFTVDWIWKRIRVRPGESIAPPVTLPAAGA